MNMDLGMAAGYVMVAVGGFALGALAGRWMMGEMRNALDAIQMRLAALEHTVVGNGTAANSAAAAPGHGLASAAPVSTKAQEQPASAPQPAPATPVATAASASPTVASAAASSPAAALEHHASAVERPPGRSRSMHRRLMITARRPWPRRSRWGGIRRLSRPRPPSRRRCMRLAWPWAPASRR